MALVDAVEEITDPAIARIAEQYVAEFETAGPLLNSFLTMQRNPELLKAALNLHRVALAQQAGSRVTAELKRLLATMVSASAGCRYCQAHTSFLASRKGCSPEKIDAVWEYETSDLFSPAERAALDLARGAGASPSGVTGEMHQIARRYWNADELIEIVAVIAAMGFANRWNDTMATPLEEPAKVFANANLADHGWSLGRH